MNKADIFARYHYLTTVQTQNLNHKTSCRKKAVSLQVQIKSLKNDLKSCVNSIEVTNKELTRLHKEKEWLMSQLCPEDLTELKNFYRNLHATK